MNYWEVYVCFKKLILVEIFQVINNLYVILKVINFKELIICLILFNFNLAF